MSNSDIQIALGPVIHFFRDNDISYYIGGSVASSSYGIARSTLDVDIIAQLNAATISPMVKTLEELYYIDELSMRNALKTESSFNIIHLETMLKVDIFIAKNSDYDKLSLQRRIVDTLDTKHGDEKYFLASCEDLIIHKLTWYIRGGKVSERQWLDIIGMIKVQQENLDISYISFWTKKFNVYDIFVDALNEAGVKLTTDKKV